MKNKINNLKIIIMTEFHKSYIAVIGRLLTRPTQKDYKFYYQCPGFADVLGNLQISWSSLPLEFKNLFITAYPQLGKILSNNCHPRHIDLDCKLFQKTLNDLRRYELQYFQTHSVDSLKG